MKAQSRPAGDNPKCIIPFVIVPGIVVSNDIKQTNHVHTGLEEK